MMDELEGFKAGFRIGKISYFNTKTGKLTPTNLANFQLLQTDADKIQYIYLITDKPKLSYRSLPTSALNNQNPVKVKNKSTYKLPYRQR